MAKEKSGLAASSAECLGFLLPGLGPDIFGEPVERQHVRFGRLDAVDDRGGP